MNKLKVDWLFWSLCRRLTELSDGEEEREAQTWDALTFTDYHLACWLRETACRNRMKHYEQAPA